MDESSNKDRKTRTSIKISIVLGIILIVVFSIVIVILLKQKQVGTEDVKRNVVVSQGNVEEVAENLISQEYVPPGYYSTQMSTVWHFQTGEAISEDAYVINDSGNTNDVYFDVFLESDESTPILQSPVIPRGAELNNISLDVSLAEGTYDCVMVYHLIDDNQDTVSTLRIAFTIIIEH